MYKILEDNTGEFCVYRGDSEQAVIDAFGTWSPHDEALPTVGEDDPVQIPSGTTVYIGEPEYLELKIVTESPAEVHWCGHGGGDIVWLKFENGQVILVTDEADIMKPAEYDYELEFEGHTPTKDDIVIIHM